MVYVLNKNGEPLMPTKRHGKVKHLLREGKAKVVRRCPFTIQILYDSTEFKQSLTLGVDTGAKTIGTAVFSENGEIVYASEIQTRGDDVKKKMDDRRMYRKNRRNRKTRYRKPRFLNRKNSKRKGRLSPTQTSINYSHMREIEFIKKLLPISQLVLECGKFDPHLMKDPSLANEKKKHWGYQKGPNYGFENTKAQVLFRDGYTCQYCGKNQKKIKNIRLDVHHIIYKSNGGSDEPENLITVCRPCHWKIHNKGMKVPVQGKLSTLKYATQMNCARAQLLRTYPESIETFGYVTKANRYYLNVPKEHYLDACTIASGGKEFTISCSLFQKKCVSRGDYKRTMGDQSESLIPHGKICGFKKFDKVIYRGKIYFIKGRMSTGYANLMDFEGNPIKFTQKPKTPKFVNMTRLSARKSTIVYEKQLSHITYFNRGE